MIFVTNTIHSNTYSDEIFRHYRLIKLAPKFPSVGDHFSDHNSDEIYFSSLNVIIFLSMNFVTKAIFLATKNISSLIFVTKNTFCCSVSSNQLQGSIPNVFGNMNSLERLFLHDNQFEGGIPKSLGDICTLYGLYLLSTISMDKFLNSSTTCKDAQKIH